MSDKKRIGVLTLHQISLKRKIFVGPEWIVDVDVAVGDGDDHPVVVAAVALNVGHLK